MIGGLQGEFGDLDIKYLKQNISKGQKYREASGEHRGTMQNPGNLKCRPRMLSG